MNGAAVLKSDQEICCNYRLSGCQAVQELQRLERVGEMHPVDVTGARRFPTPTPASPRIE
jgi:hypothetical protein